MLWKFTFLDENHLDENFEAKNSLKIAFLHYFESLKSYNTLKVQFEEKTSVFWLILIFLIFWLNLIKIKVF